MSKYQFTSPGAAAGEGILQVLAQRRLEARQRMIDEVARQDSESERAARAQNIINSQTANEGQLLDQAKPGWSMGMDLSGIDPKLLEIARKRGLVSAGARPLTPQVTTEEAGFGLPTAPDSTVDPSEAGPITSGEAPKPESQNYYVGSPEDRARTRRMEQVGKVMAAINGHPGMSETEKMLSIAQAMEDPNLPGEFYRTLETPQNVSIFDQENGGISPALDKDNHPITTRGNNQFLIKTRPPRLPNSYQNAGIDPATKKPVTLDMATGQYFTTDANGARSPYGGAIDAKPTSAGSKGNFLSPTESAVVTKSRKDYETAKTKYFNTSGIAAAKAVYTQAAITALDKLGLPSNVRSAIIETMNDPNAEDVTSVEIANGHTDLTEQEQFMLVRALSAVRGK